MSNISAAASPPTKSDNHDGINVLIGDDDNSNDASASSDEYETDSQAEELETDSDSETDEGEEEQWSLRVRLLSAVDLPPSLSPTVPLCVSLYVVGSFCVHKNVCSILYIYILAVLHYYAYI